MKRRDRRRRDARSTAPTAGAATIETATLAATESADTRSGSRAALLVCASAGLVLIAAPPRDLWPIALVSLVPLLTALRTASAGRAFFLGWVFGLLVNAGGFRWLLPLTERFGHLTMPTRVLVLVLASAYQGCVCALWASGARILEQRARVPVLLGAPLCAAIAEAAVPFVFPWHLGFLVWRAWPLTQVAELGGPVAVSALVVAINVLVAGAVADFRRSGVVSKGTRLGAIVLAAIVALGLVRAGHVALARGAAPHVKVGVVQPNAGILTADERKQHGERHLAALRDATTVLAQRGAELVVWPESAFPFYFDRELRREYAPGHPWELRRGYRGALLFGALTHTFGSGALHNSAVLVDAAGEVAGTYDKNVLLAFGEYVPFSDRYPDWAARVRERLPDSPDIDPGEQARALVAGKLRIGPLICYEDILPSQVYEDAALRPNLLVTLANHAWFGESEAPEQALALATLRSVETRRDLVRAASTGVSSIGDALGRVRARGGLHADPTAPGALLEDAALLEIGALGPVAAPLFPWACAALIAALLARARLTATR